MLLASAACAGDRELEYLEEDRFEIQKKFEYSIKHTKRGKDEQLLFTIM